MERPWVATLVDNGDVRSAGWRNAFAGTPRHLFTPEIIVSTEFGYRVLSADAPEIRGQWLAAVYSDDSLVTQHKPHAAGNRLASGEPLHVPTSSSTMPSLMARMLEALNVEDGMRVLEIGTGTGYNAALLCHRLGDHNVVSIELDAELVDLARQRLGQLGHKPVLIEGDGAAGANEHGPYDRIIATAAVPDIPPSWIQQLKPGGKILANLRGDLAAGTLCLLTKQDTDDEVIGPVLPIGGHFMWLRSEVTDPHRPTNTSEPPNVAPPTAPQPDSTPPRSLLTTKDSDSCYSYNSTRHKPSGKATPSTRPRAPNERQS